MNSNLPVTTPAEAIAIAPEQLEVANAFLQTPNISKVSEELNVPRETVVQILGSREVKAYIDSVYFNTGFNNKFHMRQLMDTIIQKKLKDLDEADTGSTKDITEILALSHKMTIEHLQLELQLEKLRAPKANVVTNVQINEGHQNTRYGALINQLLNENTIDV